MKEKITISTDFNKDGVVVTALSVMLVQNGKANYLGTFHGSHASKLYSRIKSPEKDSEISWLEYDYDKRVLQITNFSTKGKNVPRVSIRKGDEAEELYSKLKEAKK